MECYLLLNYIGRLYRSAEPRNVSAVSWLSGVHSTNSNCARRVSLTLTEAQHWCDFKNPWPAAPAYLAGTLPNVLFITLSTSTMKFPVPVNSIVPVCVPISPKKSGTVSAKNPPAAL